MNKLQNLYGIAFKNCRLDSILTKICSCWPCSTTPEQLSENWTAATSFTYKPLTFGFTTGKFANNKHKRFGMLVVLHQLLIQSFKLLLIRLLLNCLHAKTQNASESISQIISIDCPENIFSQHNYLKMGISTPSIDVIKSFQKY